MSVPAQSAAFAVGVPPDICAFHRYTRNSALPYRTLVRAVSNARSGLGPEISHLTYSTTYEPFTPSNSGQRLLPTYHRLLARSWPELLLQVPSFSSLLKAVYDPRAFVLHAALLRQAFAHCARFPTAASRRSLDRVSVPVWLIVLSDQLPVDALVSRYLTN